jgi:RimJ/RimL family protein N-acetyltransferase
LKKLSLKTLPQNVRAQKCFSKIGFSADGFVDEDGHHFMCMTLGREQWLEIAGHAASPHPFESQSDQTAQ